MPSGRLLMALRLLAGPLVLAGFFLPWASGPGLLSAQDFSGFAMVGVSGRLQVLDLPLETSVALHGVRLALVGVAVAGVWLALLAPLASRHVLYRAAGWYVALLALAALSMGLARSGVVVPPPGLALLLLGALAFAAAEVILALAARRWPRPEASIVTR